MKVGSLTAMFHNVARSIASRIKLRPHVQPVPIQEAEETSTRTIHCGTHGEQAETFVCQHIADGLIRHDRVGFFWTVEDPDNPHPDAWCAECEGRVKLTGGEWEGEASEHLKPKILCGECYGAAKVFHMGGDPWS
jgi:hypothetical protein